VRASGPLASGVCSVISVEEVRAVLLDIDGVLTVSWKPLPGAVDAVRALRDAGLRLALLTNTTSRTRSWIAGTLAEVGFPVRPQDVLTAPAATAAHLARHRPEARCLLLSSGDVAEDMAGVSLVDTNPDVVVIGGAGPEFGYSALNDVFGHLQHGAELVAMHRNLFWRTEGGLQLDSGAFLAGLERAAGVEALVLGKPAPEFFAAALHHVHTPAEAAVMVGDDVEADVLGGQAVGMTGVLVRTGKFLPDAEDGVGGERPLHVVDSVADLPALLGLP
jgi:HAD superfamily hydrolase (TIGR01458 family)